MEAVARLLASEGTERALAVTEHGERLRRLEPAKSPRPSRELLRGPKSHLLFFVLGNIKSCPALNAWRQEFNLCISRRVQLMFGHARFKSPEMPLPSVQRRELGAPLEPGQCRAGGALGDSLQRPLELFVVG